MTERINEIVNEALGLISNASNSDDVQNIRNQFLSKKSELMSLMSTLGNLSPEERKTVGQELNLAKGKIAEALDAKQKDILKNALPLKRFWHLSILDKIGMTTYCKIFTVCKDAVENNSPQQISMFDI